jgi:hypothetical protein
MVIKNLALSYGITFSNNYASSLFNNYLSALKKEDFKKADKLLVSCHLTSSLFKALSSWYSNKFCRDILIFQK